MKPRVLLILALGLCLSPSPALAQNVPDPSETARFHLGALSLTPKFGVRNLGMDTNIFNVAESPQKDLTATFTGGVDTWIRVGRAYLAGRTTGDWHYFQRASDQRSVDLSQEGRVDVDLLRLVPRVGGSFLNSRQRPNDEFDIRVQQQNVSAFVGVMVPIGSKARVDFEWKEQEYDYSVGSFGDGAIASALNRKSQLAAFTGGFDVTPLTRFLVRADIRKDRFAFAGERNSDSVRVMPGVELQPSAVVSGRAFVGYRRFRTPSQTVPDVTSLVAMVELKFVAADAFRVTGQFNRDLDYSLDLDESVYVSTSVGMEMLKAVGLEWDVVGRFRNASLGYQQNGSVPGRVDRVWLVGTGVGRRIGTELRLGFDVDFINRTSDLAARGYDGFKYGFSVTYGY